MPINVNVHNPIVEIALSTIIGAGAIVVEDVPAGATVVSPKAKIINTN